MTPRELQVIDCILEGARSLPSIAAALDPPVSRRTAEAHVASIASKIDEGFEPDSPGFWRVVIWSVYVRRDAAQSGATE